MREWIRRVNPGVLVLSGMGGIGKTELARHFIETFTFYNTSSCIITWFDGLSNYDLHKSLLQLSKYLGFVDSEQHELQSIDGIIINITKNIEQKIRPQHPTAKWIVVFDNVFEDDGLTNGLKSLINANAFILITTRKSGMFAGEAEQICLQSFTIREACTLANVLISVSNQQAVEQLCATLNYHPLAIQQAISYIKCQQVTSLRGSSYGISSFIKEWSGDSIHILKHELKLSSYNVSVYKMVTGTIEQIESLFKDRGDRAIQLLLILSLVQCEGIRLDVLYHLLNDCDKSSLGRILDCEDTDLMEIIESELALLKCFSLIELEADIITVVRLVQIVIKNVSPWEDVITILMDGIKIEGISESLINPAVCILFHAQGTDRILCKFRSPAFPRRLEMRISSFGMNYKDIMRNNRTQFYSVFSGDNILENTGRPKKASQGTDHVQLGRKILLKRSRKTVLDFKSYNQKIDKNEIQKRNCILC